MVLAAAAEASDPLTLLLQYGVLGIFAVLLILYARSSLARERERSDQAAAQAQELNTYIREELLKNLGDATRLHTQVAEVLEEAIQLLTEVKIRDSLVQRDSSRQLPPPGGGRRV